MFITLYVVVALIVIVCMNMVIIKRNKRLSRLQTSEKINQKEASQSKAGKSSSAYQFQIDEKNESQKPVNETAQHATQDYVFKKGITRNKILVAMVFGMFITILNQTLLNTALPVINTDFNISASTGQWLMTGFMLVNGILIPVSAYLFHKFSYRSLFLVAMVVFTLGSFVCAIAWSFPVMMTGRVLQAIGAGVLMPLGTNVFMTIFPPQKRGMAMGILGVAMILAPAIGPTLSGYIVENFDWHVMFYGMFAVGFLSFMLSYIWFGIYQKTTHPKADIPGIIFSTLGFGALLYGFSEAGNKGLGFYGNHCHVSDWKYVYNRVCYT